TRSAAFSVPASPPTSTYLTTRSEPSAARVSSRALIDEFPAVTRVAPSGEDPTPSRIARSHDALIFSPLYVDAQAVAPYRIGRGNGAPRWTGPPREDLGRLQAGRARPRIRHRSGAADAGGS